MGKLEEFTEKSPEFAKARKGIECLAKLANREWKRAGGQHGCYRILTSPEDEIDKWEEYKGFEPKKSFWGRFVCTANKYLPWMWEQEIKPPWLRPPEVMIEIERWDIKCLEYAKAAVGKYPIKQINCHCTEAEDIYVNNQDLVLSECWTHDFINIKDIKRIFIGPKTRPQVKAKAEAFAKRHKIPITYGFPDPEIDEEQEEWYRKNYPPKEAERLIKEWRELLRKERKEPLLDFLNFLKKHSEKCHDWFHPPRDVIAAALAEAYDKVMHGVTPVGASDALSIMIETGKREPTLHPVWSIGQPAEACIKLSSSNPASPRKKYHTAEEIVKRFIEGVRG